MKTLALLLCLLAGPLFAEEVLVPVAVEVVSRAEAIGPLDCVRIWLDVPAENIKTLRWTCHPEPKLMQVGITIGDNPRPFVIFQAGASGSFGLSVAYYDGEMHMKKYVVQTGGDIDPRPFPKPPPTPVPTPGKRTVIILEESGDKDREKYAPILFSSKLRSYLKQKGHRLEIPDVDDVPMALAQRNLQGKPLPRLILEDGDGKLLFQGPLPATVEAVLTLIQKHGG